MQPDLSACLTLAAIGNWILTFLSVTLTWPVCALAMVLFVGLTFKQAIAKWIERLEAEFDGKRIRFYPQSAAPLSTRALVDEALTLPAGLFPPGSHAAAFETQISLAANGRPDDETREARLLKIAVLWRLTAMFEWIYASLLGSQMQLLERLHLSTRLPMNEARECYEDGKRREPAAYTNYSFEGWLAWLRDQAKLVTVEEGEVLTLTYEGNFFFQFLRMRGYSHARFG